MHKGFLRNTSHAGPAYIVRFSDYAGPHEEVHYFASEAMFRFQQLCAFPGVSDVSWRTPSGTIFASAKVRERGGL